MSLMPCLFEMDTKPLPSLHEHYLLYDNYRNMQEASCDKCNQKISDMAFSCESCKFWLHKSCAEQQLPSDIWHPLHRDHNLDRFCPPKNVSGDFICDNCFNLSNGCRYKCNEDECIFYLDIKCTSSTYDLTPKEGSKSDDDKQLGKWIEHYSQPSRLILCKYRKVSKYDYFCNWCEKPLSGLIYYNWLSVKTFFLHKSCLSKIPKNIQHPFHPSSHPLRIRNDVTFLGFTGICNACNLGFGLSSSGQNAYCCRECDFQLHVYCALLKPTINLECNNNHKLTYIQSSASKRKRPMFCSKSSSCKYHFDRDRNERRAMYRCVPCNYNIHVDCLIPSTSAHKYHRHGLRLMDSFREDDCIEYFCDICEKWRNPNHHVYCYKKCAFIAHIECALDKSVEMIGYVGLEDEEITQAQHNGADHHQDQPINYFAHNHPLRRLEEQLIENDKKEEKLFCEACHLEIFYHEAAYVCVRDCKYYLHKTCADLRFEMTLKHPLHMQHPLTFLEKPPSTLSFDNDEFVCDGCRHVSNGFIYYCFPCKFKLDIRCAALQVIASEKVMERQLELTNHFIHPDPPVLANFRNTYRNIRNCHACRLPVFGRAECCLKCRFYLHESCFENLPQEIKIPCHSHALHALPLKPDLIFGEFVSVDYSCLACNSPNFEECCYSCLQCSNTNIYLHFSCANSLKRPLRSRSYIHHHNLYLVQTEKLGKQPFCSKCHKSLGEKEKSTYRCIECKLNFHLKCVEIPCKVKSERHRHTILFKDCFTEDDPGEYYCDICEESRDRREAVYYCQECYGLFIAHIECVINEGVEVVEAMNDTWGIPSLISNTNMQLNFQANGDSSMISTKAKVDHGETTKAKDLGDTT